MCGYESEGVKNAGNEIEGMKLREWKCRDENVGMKKQEMKNGGWKCGYENVGMKSLGMNYQGMKNLGVKKTGDENAGMKLREWSVTQPNSVPTLFSYKVGLIFPDKRNHS